jgi:hypothetical protein
MTLTQESLEKSKSIQKLEEAAADLYKALQTGRDRGLREFQCGFMLDSNFLTSLSPDMAAGMERLPEYKTYNLQFCKRIFDYLSIVFTAQVLGLPAVSMEGADVVSVILSRRCSLVITTVWSKVAVAAVPQWLNTKHWGSTLGGTLGWYCTSRRWMRLYTANSVLYVQYVSFDDSSAD